MNDLEKDMLQTEYARAREYYSTRPVQYRGSLVLSQADVQFLPIDLGVVYGSVSDEIRTKPREARDFASTFGAVRVQLGLGNAPTRFCLEQDGVYPKDLRTEVATKAVRPLEATLRMDEVDAPYAYILASNGENQTVEMSLIQALHMVDTAMVTGRYYDTLPLVRVANTEELLRLRGANPDVFLRTYGNVRKLKDVPLLLGCVVETSTLESSGIQTSALSNETLKNEAPVRERIETGARNEVSFVGITTAKRPHIGHGFLLAKAIAKSASGEVVVELNDQGPRVEGMLVNLAETLRITPEEAAQQVSSGDVSVEQIESCYKARDTKLPIPEIDVAYALTTNNSFYSELLSRLQPPGTQLTAIANSNMSSMQPTVEQLDGYRSLFSGSGMDILVNPLDGNAMPIEKAGKPTLQGILVRLCGQYALTLVDSPPCLTKQEVTIIQANGLQVEQDSGCGLLLDFNSASGTNGRSIQLESLIDPESASGTELAALRLVMDNGYFFVSETGSLCPNFATNDAFLSAYQAALKKLEATDIETVVKRPIEFKNVKTQLIQGVLSSVYEQFPVTGKITGGEICRLLNAFPILASTLPGRIVADAANQPSDQSIRKNILRGKPTGLMQKIRSADASTIVRLIRGSCESDQAYLGTYLSGTELGDMLVYMGYRGSSTMEVLDKIAQMKGVYKIA